MATEGIPIGHMKECVVLAAQRILSAFKQHKQKKTERRYTERRISFNNRLSKSLQPFIKDKIIQNAISYKEKNGIKSTD